MPARVSHPYFNICELNWLALYFKAFIVDSLKERKKERKKEKKKERNDSDTYIISVILSVIQQTKKFKK
jgi:predicted nucleic acid-binding protein